MITKFKIFETTYVTHQNGGRSFAVNYDKKSGFIDILKNKYNRYPNVKKVWSGDKEDDNSSVLIEFPNKKYMFVGTEIYEFETEEFITNYYSMIGNSDVPYPVALSKNYVYLMLDKVYINRKEFPKDTNWKDCYRFYYDNKDILKKFKFKNFKDIKENIFEQFHPDDPYNEEIWDEVSFEDMINILKDMDEIEIEEEVRQPGCEYVMFWYKPRGAKLELDYYNYKPWVLSYFLDPNNPFDGPDKQDRITIFTKDEVLNKIRSLTSDLAKYYENYNPYDPYGEEKWEDNNSPYVPFDDDQNFDEWLSKIGVDEKDKRSLIHLYHKAMSEKNKIERGRIIFEEFIPLINMIADNLNLYGEDKDNFIGAMIIGNNFNLLYT